MQESARFEIKGRGQITVTFVQNSSDEIKKAFRLITGWRLNNTVVGSTVTTEYTVFNTGTEKLPFTIGGHPAFNCPLAEGEAFEDYKVKFDRVMTHKCLRPDVVSCLVDTSKRFNVLENTDEIAMRHELFDLDAMWFDGIESKSATLIGKSGRGVRLDYQDFENLLIWSSSNGGKFVALEPWTVFQPALMKTDF